MRPFFSILIPTKDRPELLAKAIQSVIHQTFSDYELVIVDNSTNMLSSKLMEKYRDVRIRLLKTGGLDMPDNWEYAYSNASGSYSIMLTDRMYFANENVLKNILDVIKIHPDKIITWNWSIEGNDIDNIVPEFKLTKSNDILNSFFYGGNERHWFNVVSPKGLNTCLPNELYRDVLNKYDRLCFPLSPDFTMSFVLLHEVDEIFHSNIPLMISGGMAVSNGNNNKRDKGGIIKYLDENKLEEKDLFEHAIIPVAGVFNSMYNDLFAISKKFNWNLNWDLVNKVEYFILVYGEIKNNLYQDDIESDLAKWNLALNKEPVKIQKSVKARIKSDQKKVKVNPFYLKIFKRIYKGSKRFLHSRISMI